jgi:hypothetical protein
MAEINSDNWTVDSFFTGGLGSVSATQFRDYLLKNNLTEPNPNERNKSYSFTLKSPQDPGNVSQFYLNESGFPTEVYLLRSSNLNQNKYGPVKYTQFTINNQQPTDFIEEDTGYLQYKTSSGSDFRASLVGRQLGFGYGAGIQFDSDLNTIGKQQRKEEFKQRIKQNFTQQTVNRINLDPIGLLTGQDIFLKDYTITKGTGLGGQIIEFGTNLFGVNLPISPIPDGAFGRYGDLNDKGVSNDLESYETILRFTGSGQKSILFNSLSENRYGPTLVSNNTPPPDSGISALVKKAENTLLKLGGPGEAPQLRKYTDRDQTPVDNTNREQSLVNKINKGVANTINSLVNKQTGKKTEWELPTNEPDDITVNSEMGFDELGTPSTPVERDNWSKKGYSADKIVLLQVSNEGYNIKTGLPSSIQQPENNPPLQNLMYWGIRNNNPFKRGLLKHTQNLINSADEKQNHKARFIGVVNSDSNYNENGLHKDYSQGNTVLTKEGDAYCRSWSVRRPYDTYDELIRSSRLWRNNSISIDPKSVELNQYTVLQESGKPKIAWEYDDNFERRFNTSKVEEMIIPYMFSIENLAWKDSPHYFRLPNCEKGPHGGRIMWFPPYDINFTDNTSINWDTTNFIGRAEPIYTYNNTERTGTLGFSIVVDHPSILNTIKNEFSVNLESFFAGCDIDNAKRILSEKIGEVSEIEDKPILLDEIKPTTIDVPDVNIDLKYHFKNATSLNDKDNDPNRGGNSSSDCTNASTPGSLGRCIDTNYESYQTFTAIDNPNLYKISQGANTYDDFVNQITLYSDNDSLTNVKYKRPPCPGVTNWGPNANQFFKDLNFCINTTNFTFTADTIVYSSNTHGILLERPGFNYDFFNKQFEINGNTYTGINGLAKFLTTDPIGKAYKIEIRGAYSSAAVGSESNKYNIKLAEDRAKSVKDYLFNLMKLEEQNNGIVKWEQNNTEIPLYEEKDFESSTERWSLEINPRQTQGKSTLNEFEGTPFHLHPQDYENEKQIEQRFGSIKLVKNPSLIQNTIDSYIQKENERIKNENNKITEETKKLNEAKLEEERKKLFTNYSNKMVMECDYFETIKRTDPFIYNSLREKLKNFHPAFHAITPEGLNNRLNFIQQCGRQGPSLSDPNQPQNTAFGRPPVCILRIGDFYFTKIIIDSINISYDPLQWDLNPEGIGVQPMIAKIDLNFKFIGGSSLKGPITQLQNAVSYNFFANTALYHKLERFVANRNQTGGFNETKNDTTKDEIYYYGPISDPEQEQKIKSDLSTDFKNRSENIVDNITSNQQVTDTTEKPITDEEKVKIDGCTEDTPCN